MLYIDSIWEYIVNFLELALFIIFIHKKLRIRANYKHQAVLMFLFVSFQFAVLCTLNKMGILGYLILVLMCILFAPISNHKICLTTKQKWIHKLISVIIVSIGFLLFYKIGNTKMNTTLFYSFFCVIILMIVETIKNLMRHFK